MQHAHHEWLEMVADKMGHEYGRLRADAATPARIQQVGHGAEATWVQFLTEWLPPGYEVGRRKYILPEADGDGDEFETDIVVFAPSYPTALRVQERVLAAGVAAAFSVKLTADAAGLREAAESAVKLSRGLKPRNGTPRSEMLRPFPFGYLAHSHSWTSPASAPWDNVARNLQLNDETFVQHPRDSLDVVCIADLGMWNQMYLPYTPNGAIPTAGVSASTAMIGSSGPQPVAMLISWLYERLSLTNPALTGLSDGFRLTTGGQGSGPQRRWPLDAVFTADVRSQLHHKAYGGGGPDWATSF
jgi:hypothetical protein